MSTAPSTPRQRPRQVTFGATLAVVGGAFAILVLIATAEQLYSSQMRNVLADALSDPRASQLDISIDTALELAKYTIMAMAVLSVASLVLGVFVLRRHRSARLGLTALGLVVALLSLLAGPPGWAIAAYVATSLVMLWSKPARAWFSNSSTHASSQPPYSAGPYSSPPPPPPPPGSSR